MGGSKSKEERKTKDAAVERPGNRDIEMEMEPEADSGPGWLSGLQKRSMEYLEYQNRFAFTTETVSNTFDLQRLDEIRAAADNKFGQLSMLEAGTMDCYQKMLDDPGNEEKKKEGNEAFEVCKSRLDVCKRLYETLVDKIIARKKDVQADPKLAKKNGLLQRFRTMRARSPMLQLLARVKLFEEKPGYSEAKPPGIMDRLMTEVGEMTGIGKDDLDNLNKIKDVKSDVDDHKKDAAEFKKALASGGKTVEEKKGPLDGVFGMVKDTAMLIKNTVTFFKNYDKMSEDNRDDKVVSLVTSGIKVATSAVGKIVDLLASVPFLGGILGLIKNAITFFVNGYTFYKSQKRMGQLRERKKALKAKMLKRKQRYQSKENLRGLKLYSYVSTDKNQKVKMDSKVRDNREKRGLSEYASGARSTMRDHEGAKDATYYRAKAEDTLQQYDEIKEAVYKNKNIRRETIWNMVLEGVSVVTNIASFIPGIGQVVAAAGKALNSGAKAAKSGGSAIISMFKNWIGSDRSDKNKAKFRSKYATHIYDNMAEAAQYVDTTGSWQIDRLDDTTVKKVAESYDYAEGMLEGMAADMPSLIDAKSKDELLKKMSGSFAREG